MCLSNVPEAECCGVRDSQRVCYIVPEFARPHALRQGRANYVLVFSTRLLLANILEPQRGIHTSTQGLSVQLFVGRYCVRSSGY